MGIALWIGGGVVALVAARLIPAARPSVCLELAIVLLAAAALGITASALDFGGWREPDWRAGLFVCFGSFAAVGSVRFANLALRKKTTGGLS